MFTPTISISILNLVFSWEGWINLGMTDVLPKPFTKDSLLGMLEKYLSKMKLTQHMQQQFELGYGIPAALKPQRVVELLPEETEKQQEPQRQQHQQSQQTP